MFMSKKPSNNFENYQKNLPHDIAAGIVVFLVAIPLCLGIALASGAPFFAGIISGVVGGLLVPLLSKSQLSVSGPAAGLTAMVLMCIKGIGSYEGFLVALVIAGGIQVLLGMLRLGIVAYYIPSSVIRGMLAAIGLILILKQLPHATGYDVEIFEDDKFFVSDTENTFTLLLHSLSSIEWGAVIISVASLAVLIAWDNSPLKKIYWLPPALIVVILGIIFNEIFIQYFPALKLGSTHLVNLPVIGSFNDFVNVFHTPTWSYITKGDIWFYAFQLAMIASIETLLTLEALDKLDPYKRKSPPNRELIAQGVGNSVSGLLGGIPITSVIVRSSAGINAGGRTKTFVLIHGLLLFIAVTFTSVYLNKIPLACLAAILLLVGYKLAKPSVFKEISQKGIDQLAPFVITIVAILFTDLLIGVSIGIGVGLFFIIRSNFYSSFSVTEDQDGRYVLVKFNKDLSFLNKPFLIQRLESIPRDAYVIIDALGARFIDYDILEFLDEFKQEAKYKNITVEFKNFLARHRLQMRTRAKGKVKA
jgi:MFS superfamily sulfate permease-like transporter